MALVQKTQPIGIDAVVDDLQDRLNNLGWSNYEIYPRVYKTESQNGIKAENYTSNGEYKDVFFNDTFTATSFFIDSDNKSVINHAQQIETDLSIIFQVKLDLLKPNIAHRADEEIRYDVVRVLEPNRYNFRITNVVTGISNVYTEFNTDSLQFDDMSKRHVFRINMTGTYPVDCKTVTTGV